MNYTFTYRNRKIRYKKTGEGKALLILHGWGSSAQVMMPQAGFLRDTRTCYVLDFPGFGDSEEPETGWTVDEYAGAVKAWAEHENIEKADVLAHSFGARVALKLCAENWGVGHLDKIILTGAAGMKPKRSFSFYLKKYTAKTLKAPFFLLPEKSREKGLKKLRNTKLWKKLGSSDYSKLSGVMRETFVKVVSEYLEPLLPKIPHSVLLLWGKNDTATPLYQATRMEAGLKNGALVTIANAGHYAFLDNPNAFAAITKAFLKEENE